jgi:tRNA pseudouridine38-40 synthase
MNLRLDIAYDGAPFRGYARQPGQRTVEGDLADALARIVGRDVDMTCAGRTDAGVHAVGQVAGIPDAPDDLVVERLLGSLNSLCAPSIGVSSVAVMPDGWHARFSAVSRTYIYAIDEGFPHPFRTGTTWQLPGSMDVDAMAEAAGHLVGDHDFSSFGRVPDPTASAVRNLFELKVWREGTVIRIKARANAFIQQMVRSLAGTLVAVGQGRRSPDDVPAMLAARDRSAAGPVAPPHGLCLVWVEYPGVETPPGPI